MSGTSTSGARVVQISVNPNGGVPKLAVERARLGVNGVEGDKQNNRRYHGGPMRAVCVYSLERIRALQDEGHPIDAGTTGENLLLGGLDWDAIAPGTQLQIGAAQIEITDYTRPCHKITASFAGGDFMRVFQKTRPGWSRLYAKVLAEAEVRVGDAVQVLLADVHASESGASRE